MQTRQQDSASAAEPWQDLPWDTDRTREYLRGMVPRVDDGGYRFTKILVRIVLLLIRSLSWKGTDRLGTWIGTLLCFLRVRRDVAMINLDIVYGDRKTPAEKQGIYRACMLNFGRHILNYLRTPQMDARFWNDFEIENVELVEEILRRGKGLLIVGAHTGEWEIGVARIGMLGYPGFMIAKRVGHPVFEKLLIDARVDMCLGTLFNSGSMDQVLASIRRGEYMAMVVDQNMRPGRGVFVDFLGRQACTIRSSAWVVRETGVPAAAGYSCRTAPGRYKLVITEEIPWEPHPEDPEKELLINTQNHVRAQERIILEHPEIWFWIHRRWNNQPEGVPNPYRAANRAGKA